MAFVICTIDFNVVMESGIREDRGFAIEPKQFHGLFLFKIKEVKNMLCKECMRKHDFSSDFPAELGKLGALVDLMLGVRNSNSITDESIEGIGAILGDIHYRLKEMHDELYEKKEDSHE